ncbi:MAG TPA: heavy metal-responsive transcriptional regulator [Herpetosiphonaceae bacterium]|nr:heavy metal-responsive transcriptional regulator [Herpetosiphonaceae bacterium]
MVIHELASATGVPDKTIRYYEAIGLLPPPKRSANNYRQYGIEDEERLRFIAGARSLGFSIREIVTILAVRDAGVAPCNHVLTTLARRLAEIDARIAAMLTVRETLVHVHDTGSGLARDDVAGENCVCAVLKQYPRRGARQPEVKR